MEQALRRLAKSLVALVQDCHCNSKKYLRVLDFSSWKSAQPFETVIVGVVLWRVKALEVKKWPRRNEIDFCYCRDVGSWQRTLGSFSPSQ
jgi:hypothetical protein